VLGGGGLVESVKEGGREGGREGVSIAPAGAGFRETYQYHRKGRGEEGQEKGKEEGKEGGKEGWEDD